MLALHLKKFSMYKTFFELILAMLDLFLPWPDVKTTSIRLIEPYKNIGTQALLMP